MSAEIDITIPDFLLVKNRRPLPKKRRAIVEAWLARGAPSGGERLDYRKPKGLSWDEWDAAQAPIVQLAEERKQTALAKLHAQTAAQPKIPRILGYKGHLVGSRKARVHECHDVEGPDKAVKLGKTLGLKDGTVHSWIKDWAKNAQV